MLHCFSFQICKKLSGAGRGTAEWCTNVGNELSQVLTSVLTCEESLEKLRPMAQGLEDRYSKAGEAPPQVMYVDRGCCRVLGVSSIEQLFSEWSESGMVIRLDAFHWICRFDAAVRTDHHPKYPLFKSALSAALFAYNKDDMSLLVKSTRAGSSTYANLTDEQIIAKFISREDLKHFVRRVTVGAHETFTRVQNALEVLKGRAGKDGMGIALFKDDASVDQVWANQQKHLECLQDPPGMDMYTVTKHVTRNGISLPYYRTVRGSNSLEGFHRFLPSMIPGPHCAAVPFQVYLLAGIARWNSDRESDAVKGQKGRKHRTFQSPLIHRLNKRCEKLFDQVQEVNFRAPMPVGDELLGLEYLFSQSSSSFNVDGHYTEAREVLQDGDDNDEVTDVVEELDEDFGYKSDAEETLPLIAGITLTEETVSTERDPCMEDVCGPNHLPGFQHVEELSRVLVDIGLEEGRLSLNGDQRQRVLDAWNKLEIHDRQIETFDSLYSSRWGNTLFGRTKGDPPDSTLVQKLKFGKRFAPANLIDSRKNRLMYLVVKQLWLQPTSSSQTGISPRKRYITQVYQRLVQRITVEDPVLCKVGIPLMKINTKSVAEFIRRQEALSGHNVTDQGLSILQKPGSISSASLHPAPELPEVRPQTSRPQTDYPDIANLAGTRVLKVRRDLFDVAPEPTCSASQMPASTPTTLSTTPTSQPTPSSSATSLPASSSYTLLPSPTAPVLLSVSMPGTSGTMYSPSTSQHSLARSTVYRRRKLASEGSGSVKKSKMTPYRCKLCGGSTQGHNKYKKKTYCQQSNKSTSLPGQIFLDFEDFKAKVDQLHPVSANPGSNKANAQGTTLQ